MTDTLAPTKRRYQAAAEKWRREHPLPDLTDDQRAMLISLLARLRSRP